MTSPDDAPDPHDEDAPLPSRRPPGLLVTVVAALLVLALAGSLLLSVPAAFGRSAQDPASSGPSSGVSVPTVAEAAQDQPAPRLQPRTVERIRAARDDSSAAASGVVVLDPASGAAPVAEGADLPLRPASNQKIVTHFSLLHHAGPHRRLATTTVEGDDGSVVLVAGGDTLLGRDAGDPEAVVGRAGIGDLARGTAQAMDERGPVDGTVRVRLDDSLFSGPGRNPAWAPGDIAAGEIGTVHPLAFDSHRAPGGGLDPDPSASVTRVFAERLEEALEDRAGRDVAVVVEGRADTAADPLRPADQQEGVRELARVESAAVQEQAGVMMRESDNRLAEALARVAARCAGLEGSVDGARQAAEDAAGPVLAEAGAGPAELRVSDASGMSVDNRVSARALAALLRRAAVDETGRYSPMIEAFPVAGANGTLAERFDDPQEAAGRGVTRAKTGTLTTVTALSGQTIRENGRPAVVVVLLDGVEDTAAARDAADRILAAVAADRAGL